MPAARDPAVVTGGVSASRTLSGSTIGAGLGDGAAAGAGAAAPSTAFWQRGQSPSGRRECLSPHCGHWTKSAMRGSVLVVVAVVLAAVLLAPALRRFLLVAAALLLLLAVRAAAGLLLLLVRPPLRLVEPAVLSGRDARKPAGDEARLDVDEGAPVIARAVPVALPARQVPAV